MQFEKANITESKIGLILGDLPKATERERHLIKVVVLENLQHLESVLFRVKKGWIIEFHLGSSLFGKEINIHTNLPESAEKEFNRNTYHQLQWEINIKSSGSEEKSCLDSTSLFASLPLHRAGTFHYYFTDSSEKTLGSGYFIVDPVLSFGPNEVLDLDSVRCQTVLAKSLGTFDKWEERLRVSKESGYNMIHFTPIQELGGSNSSYSLKDQLKLNPAYDCKKKTYTFNDVLSLINKMRQEWKVLALGDVVLNHTANESPWLTTHPECTYNMITAPHLIPAAILDGHLHVFTKEVAEGKFINQGIPKEVYTNDHLNAIKYYLETELIPQLRLDEFYTCNVHKLGEEFLQKAEGRIPTSDVFDRSEVVLLNGMLSGRNEARVDFELAIRIFNVCRSDATDEKTRLSMCAEDFKKRLQELNSQKKHELSLHLSAAINNCIANMRYFRVQEDGPKLKVVSESSPLVPRYFTGEFLNHESVEKEILNNGQFVMAHNGWVMSSNPLKNFADPDSNVYLRRELIAWGDSVKLRYGNNYSDCPFLWDRMRKYVEMSAGIFDGIRLDNCHSTPLPVAEYLIDCARNIRPDLYVVAELFTNSDVTDNIFVNRLGITSLIREAMSAWNSHELGRQVHRFGGEPVGSFNQMTKSSLTPSVAHALFYDATHDNPSPIQKKTVFDLIPTAGLVSMACCATGSSRGYDELVPHHIHVVDERRFYPSWTDNEISDMSSVNIESGIICVKKALNQIHGSLSENGFNQIYVDQMNENIIAVTRHNPSNHENIIMVSHTCFSPPPGYISTKPYVRNLKIEGEICEILLEAYLLSKNKENPFALPQDFKQDGSFINGLTNYQVIMKQNLKLEESEVFKKIPTTDEKVLELEFNNFPPGSLIVIRVQPRASVQTSLEFLQKLKDSFLACEFDSEIVSVVSELNCSDLNLALYRCLEEESEEGRGCYNIPQYGNLVYCGLQGFESLLEKVSTKNDLGHPLCENLRQGDWMLDYIVGRLKGFKGTLKLGLLLEGIFNNLRKIPRYLIPRYFNVIVTPLSRFLKSRAAFQMSEFIRDGSTFVRLLANGSIQCVGYLESAPLPPFSPKIMPADDDRIKITMCAGLPHFTTGYMRSWGRDTFISLRGLLLLTGRYNEARYHILGYAACLRHGLIPNLLDRGVNARYNCRDAVWWWLYSIICYIDLVPNGPNILKDRVSRIFPNDDSPPMGPGLCDQPLYDVMQEALTVHFKGLAFRERNAGAEIDAHMTNEGFNNQIGVDLETGFVFGGNEWNCGTWMDKMGSDSKTGNRGKPATPRDGSAVELVALCKKVVTKLSQFNSEGVYPYSGVERVDAEGGVELRDRRITKSYKFAEWMTCRKDRLIARQMNYRADEYPKLPKWETYKLLKRTNYKTEEFVRRTNCEARQLYKMDELRGRTIRWSFKDWEEKIATNFEKYFWIPETSSPEERRPDLVHRRCIYKDSVGASQHWADYQFRCNFLIALAVAPEMVNPNNAWTAIKQAEEILLGPLGIKTLDPADWNYDGNYHNNDNSANPKVAHGFNYHQGPEWLWPVGFFLRSKIYFARLIGDDEFKKAVMEVRSYLGNHYREIISSPWRGLPELTNKNGAFCSDGCRVQAWSMGCILEVLYDLQQVK